MVEGGGHSQGAHSLEEAYGRPLSGHSPSLAAMTPTPKGKANFMQTTPTSYTIQDLKRVL